MSNILKIISLLLIISQFLFFWSNAFAETQTQFSDGDTIEVMLSPGGTEQAVILLPKEANVTSASFCISTNSSYGAPSMLTMDICNDSQIDWHFIGEGYGAFGSQYLLSSNLPAKNILIDMTDGQGRYYNDTQQIRLPKNSSIVSAKVNLTGYPIESTVIRNDYTNNSMPNISSNNVNSLDYDNLHDLLFVATTDGLTILDLKNATSVTYKNTTFPEFGSSNILALEYQSSKNRVCLATDSAICIINLNSLSIEFSMNMLGVVDIAFAGIDGLGHDRLIVATSSGGRVVDIVNSTYYEFTVTTTPSILSNDVRAVAYNTDRNIAYFGSGTNNGGVTAINLETNATFYYTKTSTPSIHQDNVKALDYDGGKLAVGCTSVNGGATIIDTITNTSRSFSSTTQIPLVSSNVFSVDYEPKTSSFIIGTNAGVTVIDLQNNSKVDYVSTAYPSIGIISNTVNAAIESLGGDELFVATNLGLTELILKAYPQNVSLSIEGNEVQVQRYLLKNKTPVDITSQVSNAISNFPEIRTFTDECMNVICNLSLNISSNTMSEIRISDIEIIYDCTINISTLRNSNFTTLLNNYLNSSNETIVSIPITLNSVLPGAVRLHSLLIVYNLPINTPPYFIHIDNLTLKAGTTLAQPLDLWNYAHDAETPSQNLTYSILSISNPNVTASISDNRYLSISVPDINASGLAQIELSTSDGKLNATTLINITIESANTPPTFSRIGNLSLRAGSDYKKAIKLSSYAKDNETPSENLTYSIISNSNSKISVYINGIYLGVKVTDMSYTGSTRVTLCVSDGMYNATSTANISVQGTTEIIPGAPTLEPLGNAWICCTVVLVGLGVAFGAILYMRHIEEKRSEEYRKEIQKKKELQKDEEKEETKGKKDAEKENTTNPNNKDNKERKDEK